LNLLLIQTDG